MKPANTLLSGLGTTVFTVMSALAAEHRAINLGQGFPDTDGPEDVLRAAADALFDGRNQYPPMTGVPELRDAVAAANRRFYGLEVDPAREVVVTSGATEAITACLMAVLDPGDEVVLFEPLYDTYLPVVRMLGAVPRLVRLAPPQWELPRAELAAAFGPRTKAILLNTPMNPAGKVFTAAELAFIADLLRQARRLRRLRRGLRAPDLRRLAAHPADDAAGPARALHAGRQRRQDVQPDRLEGRLRDRAGARWPASSPRRTRTSPSPRRPTCSARSRSGWPRTTPISRGWRPGWRPSGTCCRPGWRGSASACCRRWAATSSPPISARSGFAGDDVAFCRHITEHAGVTAIPVSAFYESEAPRHYARFAFCKREAGAGRGGRSGSAATFAAARD